MTDRTTFPTTFTTSDGLRDALSYIRSILVKQSDESGHRIERIEITRCESEEDGHEYYAVHGTVSIPRQAE